MAKAASLSKGNKKLISKKTPVEDIVESLVQRGCLDLTALLDPGACSKLPLAGGGFCDVYRGATGDGTKIAIKSLRLYERPGECDNVTKVFKRAARELYHWSKLNHPNVLPLMGLAMFRGRISMISEWMESGSLIEYVRRNPNADRTRLCIEVCAGLSHIHAQEMAHGDLKAANVLISRDGTALIADFGTSQLQGLTLEFTNTTGSGISVRWAAPELLDEDNVHHISKEADVYAFGMTVLETVTRRVPYDGSSESQVLLMVITKETPTRPVDDMSDALWNLLQSCWAFDLSERPNIASIEKGLRDLFCTTNDVKETDNQSANHSTSVKQPKRKKSGAPSSTVNGTAVANKPVREGDLEALISIEKQAAKHHNEGRFADAESLCSRVLESRKILLGERHPDSLRSMANLAVTCFARNQQSDAESLFLKVLAAQKQVLGEDHTDTLQSTENLAAMYHNQGRLADAEPLHVQALAGWKRVLGSDHIHTLQTMENLAMGYHHQGKLSEAASLGQEIVSAWEKVLGEDHPHTLQSVVNIAEIYIKQGKQAEAGSLISRVVGTKVRTLGGDHPETILCIRTLAGMFEKQGLLIEFKRLLAKIRSTNARP